MPDLFDTVVIKTKQCCRCGKRKPTSDFNVNRRFKDNLDCKCRQCAISALRKCRAAKDPGLHFKRRLKQWEQNFGLKLCAECGKMRRIENFSVQKGRIRRRSKCKDCERKKRREAYKTPERQVWTRKYNKSETRRIINMKYTNKRYKTDPVYRLKSKLRSRLTGLVSRKPGKPSVTAEIYRTLGIDMKGLLAYLTDNGRIPFDGMQVDHIIPLSAAETAEELEALSHYTNLQLLTPEENASKGNSMPAESDLHPELPSLALDVYFRNI